MAKDVKKDKKSKSQKKQKTSNNDLEEQVRALGGDQSDLDLLKGLKDGELVTGSGGSKEVDADLVNDVSNFLASMTNKGGKSQQSETQEKTTVKEVKAKKVKLQPESEGAKNKEKTKEKVLSKEKVETKSEANKNSKKNKKSQMQVDTEKEEEDSKSKLTSALLTAPLPKPGTKLVFSPSPHWYSVAPPLPPPSTPVASPTPTQLSQLSSRASTLLEKDTSTYQASAASTGHSSSDSHFLNTILTKGTLSDRLSALTLIVQASPVHNMKALETLKTMAERGKGKGGREEGLKAMRCIVDWWIGGGAPGRKLRYLRDQPLLLHPQATDQHLVAWYFEDWLKKYFFSILQILETYSLDTLVYVRTQALGFISTLLRDKPEQEQNLLRLMVNKLGDTEKAVCSRASYHILQLLQSHPNMKGVIVREIRSLIFRPAASTSSSAIQDSQQSKQNTHIRFGDDEPKKSNSSSTLGAMERWNSHAWYYSAVTLNQVVLTPTVMDREVARVLIEAYFEMFREVLGGTVKSPSDLDDQDEQPAHDKKGDGEQKKRRKEKGSKGKEKEIRGEAGFAEVEDSNSRLISAILSGVNRALPFAKIQDEDGNDVFKKHIDTLFLITHTSTFNISLQALMLILQVITTLNSTSTPSTSSTSGNSGNFATSLADRFYRTLYGSLSDPRLSKSNKQAMYLNLLFKALKADLNLERVKAFVRRFIQILVIGVGGAGGVEFVAGGLYLLGELFSTVSGLRDILSSSKVTADAEPYDPKKRDPQYAHASSSPLYELIPLLNHYHPAISLHAHQLISSKPLTATPDLTLNTLSHFLDRFIFKNPKKPKPKGSSAMQPAANLFNDTSTGVKLLKGEVTVKGAPVNDESWLKENLKKREQDVPVDEVFFWKYFKRKDEAEKAMKKKSLKRKGEGEDEGEDEDELMESDEEEEDGEGETEEKEEEEQEEAEGDSDEVDSDAEEAEIWKAMKATMPTELQDDALMEDSDSDELPSDLEDEDESIDAEDAEEGEGQSNSEEEELDEDDALSMAEDSDADDLLPLDADLPDGLIDYEGSSGEEEVEEWGGFDGGLKASKKRKRGDDEKKSNKKKLRSLPTFASYEDYAKLIEDGPEDNI
ncbi:CBF/MAK21 family protein [Abortiporus biennis]